ncbi:MAG: hypothetical protein AB7O93_25700 [Vicinamibacterales bacterium]
MASPNFIRVAVLAGCLAWTAIPALARQQVDAGAEVDVNSAYVFRGIVFSEGAVTQSKAWASVGDLYVYAWSNVAFPPAEGVRPLDEVDLGAAYTFRRGSLAITPALDVYVYRTSALQAAAGQVPRTAEVSTTFTYSAGGTDIFVRHVVDALGYAGAYFAQVGVTRSGRIAPGTDLGVEASMGWASARYNRSYVGVRRPGVGLVATRVLATRTLGPRMSVTTHVDLSAVPDARLRVGLPRPTVAAAGITLGVHR